MENEEGIYTVEGGRAAMIVWRSKGGPWYEMRRDDKRGSHAGRVGRDEIGDSRDSKS